MRDSRAVDATVTAHDGTRLAARRTGRGAPVVLVHGSAGGLDSWEPVVPLLADEFELWVYARRGYAPSDRPSRQKTFADDVRDVEAVLTAAGGQAHLVGASYGATVVLHAARAGVPGIRSVSVFEPPLFAAGAGLHNVLDRYRALVEAGDLLTASRLFAEEVARVPAALLDALADAAVEPDAVQARDEAIGCLHDLEAMVTDEPDSSRWTGVAAPVLLMHGSETWPPMPAAMDRLAHTLPQVDRVVLSGEAHFATHTAPALFADSLRTFLHANR